MNSKEPFKWRHFQTEIILLNVRWYLKYPLSYRNLEEIMLERGLSVDHSTIARWVLTYSPQIEESELRQVKYLNNLVEQDHKSVKKITNYGLGYKSFHTAWRTIRGIEIMHMINKGQVEGIGKKDILGQKKFVESLFRNAV